MGVIKRMKSPTPRLFRKIRNIGIAAGTIGGTLLAAPIALPALLITAAGYLTVAGTVAATISQVVTGDDEMKLWEEEVPHENTKRQ